MPTEEYYGKIETLQQRLGEAKSREDTELEVTTLIEIGKLAASVGDYGLANMYLDLAACVIQDSKIALGRLHEALGERALILRRAKRYQESLNLYKQAAAAARENAGPLEYALWVGKQGTIYRLMGKTDLARDDFEKARELYSALGEKGIAGVADQEGNLGLLAHDRGEDKAAEEAYRRAVRLALSVGDSDLVNTWSINSGNELTRKRRYHEAWTFYEKAMEAALLIGDDFRIRSTAALWSASYRNAHRPREAAETLINAAGRISHSALKCELLGEAMADLELAGAWQRLLDIGSELVKLLEERGADPARLAHCNSTVNMARERLRRKRRTRRSDTDEPTALDLYIPSSMAKYQTSGNFLGMRDVAHLICDVNLGLMNPTEGAWKPLLSETCLRYKVIGDAMKALDEAGFPEQSLELSQRFKSLGFCLPSIERIQEMRIQNEEIASYLTSLEALSETVKALKGPATEDSSQRIDAVRAAGEMLLENGEKLRDQDRILHARLGGLIRPQELIDALPIDSPVAIVDLFVSPDATILHILVRKGNNVRVSPGLAPEFSAKHARDLLVIWAECNIAHEITERQGQGLMEISRVLHDKLFCSVAKTLSELAVTQIILIPDIFTRHLPLHLAGVCAENVTTIIEHINMRDIPADAQVLSEVFPVEYAPCLQAVAVSQHQKRPREISAVLSLTDPRSDLPGQRNTSKWLTSRLPKTLKYTSHIGEEATLANLSSGIDKASVIVIGTHGFLDTAHPNDSFLEFHDGRWTMGDILDRPAFTTSPVIILSACEVGAIAPTPDELAASGIPGALISAGAACVLGSLWPVEDISMGYIVERFLTHLSHPGFRPSAALFRALCDLRQLSKQEALERCYGLCEEMERDGTADRLPEQFLLLNNLIEWIEDSDSPRPFASPQVWGGIVIVGSGWHSPAGAMVGGVDTLMSAIEVRLKRENARSSMAKGQFNEARKILEEILTYAVGTERASTLEALAWAVWRSRRRGNEQAVKREAIDLLAQAEFLAKGEQDEQLLRNINATRHKIKLRKEG